MKKALIAIVAGFLAMSTQAAQINWGATGQIKYDNVVVGNGGSTFKLVALYDITEDWTSYAVKVANGTATDHVIAEKSANAGSMVSSSVSPYIFTFATENDQANKKFVDGARFAFIALTSDNQGNDYYWASDVYAVSETASEVVGFTYDAVSKKYTAEVSAPQTMNTHWTPVPEPSTAALALAGLALLLKRRKA